MKDERLGLPSCSSLARLQKCPHSLRYDREEEKKVVTEIAEKGTRIHAYLAGEPILLNKQELDLANSCQVVAQRVIEEWAGEEGTQELLKEERVFYESAGKKIYSGKPDLAIAKRDEELKGHILILDYKTGPNEYETANQNLQLRGLAVAIRDFIRREYDEDVETISCAVIQPLVTWEPSIITYSRAHLDQAEEEIVSICTAKDQGPVANRYCNFCQGFVVCDACQKATGEISIMRQNVYDLVKSKDPRQRRELYNTACLAIKTASSIIKACKEMLQSGEEIPGLALKDGKTMRQISPSVAKMIASRFMPEATIDNCIKISVTKLYEEFYRMKNMTAKVSHKECKEIFNNIFGPYITTTKQDQTINIVSNE
jgi:hypothetical protein